MEHCSTPETGVEHKVEQWVEQKVEHWVEQRSKNEQNCRRVSENHVSPKPGGVGGVEHCSTQCSTFCSTFFQLLECIKRLFLGRG